MTWTWKTTSNDEVYVDRGDGSGFLRPTLDDSDGNVAKTIGRVEQWTSLAQSIGVPNGSPLHWTLGVIYAESGGNPNAVSPVGARGLMQVMPATASALGYSPDSMFQPPSNIGAGTTLLGDSRDKKLDLPASLSIYNAGPSVNGGPKKSLKSPWGYVENDGYITRAVAAANYFRRKALGGMSAKNESFPIPLIAIGLLLLKYGWK